MGYVDTSSSPLGVLCVRKRGRDNNDKQIRTIDIGWVIDEYMVATGDHDDHDTIERAYVKRYKHNNPCTKPGRSDVEMEDTFDILLLTN